MRRWLSTTTILSATVLIAGCATMGVGSYVAQPLLADQYLTYEWGPADALPTGDARLDNNAILNDELTGAIDLGLAAKGLARAEAGTRPDLLIHYHLTVKRKVVSYKTDDAAGAYPPHGTDARVQQYDAGTLVLDVIDARTERLLWRGWVEDTLENMIHDQKRMERHVAASVGNLMERFPFGTN